METKLFLTELANLDTADIAGMRVLGAAAAEDARHPARVLTRMLNDARAETRDKALSILSRLAELSIVPMLEAPPMADPGIQVWGLQTLVETLMALRQQLLDWLRELLQDRQALPQTKGAGRTRVCDEAFLLTGRVLAFTNDPDSEQARRDAFLRLGPEDRDRKIREALQRRTWPPDEPD